MSHKRVDLALTRVVDSAAASSSSVMAPREPARRMGGASVEFVGLVDKQALADLYRVPRAVIPSEEDYGLTPIEAQASGRPVIAYRAGGGRSRPSPKAKVVSSSGSKRRRVSKMR